MKDALALALVHFLWQGAALAIVAAVLMRAARGSAQARYAIGVATLCAMVIAPVATTAWLLQSPPGAGVVEGPTMPPSTFPALTADGVVTLATSVSPITAGETRPATAAFPYATAVLFAWAIGVVVLSARLAGGWLIADRLATHGVRPVVAELQATARLLAAQLRLSRPVRILESTSVAVPVMVGWLKPVVLLPAAAIVGLPADQLEALLAHELAHVRRHDYLVNLLQSAVETMLFYHPGVWWVSGQVRADREHCCDDLALSVTERVTYVTALTHVAALTAPGLALAATDGSLHGRVRRLLGPERERRSGSVWLAILPVALVIAVATPMSGTTEEVVGPESQLETAIHSAPESQTPSAIGEATNVRAALPPERGAVGTPERVTVQATPQSPPPRADTIAPGDRLRIQFHGVPLEDQEMNGEYRVSSLGTVHVKYLNDLAVGGLTAIQAQAAIQSSLEGKGLYRPGFIRAEVTVLPLAASADTTILVPPPSQAVPPTAPPQVKPGETIVINVQGRPELSGEYVVQPDGTIKLKGVQAEVIEVQVGGAVRSPGNIRMPGSDLRVSRAIAQVGGFASNAGHEVEIIRRGPDLGMITIVVTRAQLDANEDPGLQNFDRVNVKFGRVFFVNGEVARQGEMRWEPGMTVEKALSLAGGPTARFSLARSRIERPVKDKDGRVLKYERIVNLKMETLIQPDDVLVAGRKIM